MQKRTKKREKHAKHMQNTCRPHRKKHAQQKKACKKQGIIKPTPENMQKAWRNTRKKQHTTHKNTTKICEHKRKKTVKTPQQTAQKHVKTPQKHANINAKNV